jgi:maleylacetoacetate isomerase
MNLKQIEFDYIPIHLVKNEQNSEEYKKLNPNATVPSLKLKDGKTIAQSTAIIEYLEEVYDTHKLLPTDAFDKAQVRAICNLIGCDIQPVQNLRVLTYIGESKGEFAKHFITLGFEALEQVLKKVSGVYSFGDSVTLADCFLVPQVYNAIRWGVNMEKFPLIVEINARLVALAAFKDADPSVQPDAQ